MTKEEEIARAAIAQMLAICTQAGDARKADAYAQSFTENGVLDLGGTDRGARSDPPLDGCALRHPPACGRLTRLRQSSPDYMPNRPDI
jgi:hypothetical protein